MKSDGVFFQFHAACLRVTLDFVACYSVNYWSARHTTHTTMDEELRGFAGLVSGACAKAMKECVEAWVDWRAFVADSAAVAALLQYPRTVLIVGTVAFISLTVWIYCSFVGRPTIMAVGPVSKDNDPAADFKGDIKVDDRPPSKKDLDDVADLPVLDADGKSYTFKTLYADNEKGARRVLIIFIRHFFCGVCSPPTSPSPLFSCAIPLQGTRLT